MFYTVKQQSENILFTNKINQADKTSYWSNSHPTLLKAIFLKFSEYLLQIVLML